MLKITRSLFLQIFNAPLNCPAIYKSLFFLSHLFWLTFIILMQRQRTMSLCSFRSSSILELLTEHGAQLQREEPKSSSPSLRLLCRQHLPGSPSVHWALIAWAVLYFLKKRGSLSWHEKRRLLGQVLGEQLNRSREKNKTMKGQNKEADRGMTWADRRSDINEWTGDDETNRSLNTQTSKR